MTKAAVFSLQETRDALQLQLAVGGPGHPRHRRGGDQHLGLLPRQDVPHQPRPLHLHVPVPLVSPQEHHHDLDHLPDHGTVHGALSRRLQTNLLPHFRQEIGFSLIILNISGNSKFIKQKNANEFSAALLAT